MKRKPIKRYARHIVQTLQEAGYTAFYAGGWVRDFLLGKKSDDIDIATSAHPEEVMKLFPHSIAVGVQFGVVRVRHFGHEFEVATFRSDNLYIDGRRPSSISLHSSPEQDAQRRDFTINGMFYDPICRKVYDYVGGKKDLKRKILATIGSPYERFKEDRLRIIRAIRFKNVFHLKAEKTTWQAIVDECAHVVPSVSPERIWQELDKMLKKGVLFSCLEDMNACSLLCHLFPHLKNVTQSYLQNAFEAVKRYKNNSLAAVLCLITPEQARKDLAEKYRLSSKEKAVMTAYSQLEKALTPHQKKDVLARLYAVPEIEAALEAFAATKKASVSFLRRQRAKQRELLFWINQVKTRKFLLGGENFKELGIPAGKRLGDLIEKAFSLSCRLGIKNKQKLLSLLHKQTIL
jgi:poly(A) polymerase